MGRKSIVLLAATLLTSSCYDSFSSLGSDETASNGTLPNTTIEELHTIYSTGVREINQELIVEGCVTANDEYGNFFKSFIIESDGYALEILDGLYDSYVRHPLGATISVSLNSLGIDRYLGVLRAGLVAPATASYSLDYMSANAVVDNYITLTDFGNLLSPTLRTIGELDEQQAGQLIKVEALQLHTEDGVERTWEEYALFRDANLDTLWCYTSSYADFAASKIPQGEISLTGILEYGSTDSYSDQFLIKLRSETDCSY